jgi:hypothetical protein
VSGRALLIALVAVGTLTAAAARADDATPDLVRMRFVERGNDLTVSTAFTKLFDSSAYNALDTGFASTVVIRAWIYPRDGADPVAFQYVQRSVVYDIWDEVYVLRLDEPTGRRTLKVKYKAEALKELTSVEGLPIARLADLPYDAVYTLSMIVELNPVSKETLAEVRRWLSQGNGGGLDRGGSFFGSFVSVFVNPKIAEADRVVSLRSQPFFRPHP